MISDTSVRNHSLVFSLCCLIYHQWTFWYLWTFFKFLSLSFKEKNIHNQNPIGLIAELIKSDIIWRWAQISYSRLTRNTDQQCYPIFNNYLLKLLNPVFWIQIKIICLWKIISATLTNQIIYFNAIIQKGRIKTCDQNLRLKKLIGILKKCSSDDRLI